MNPPPNIGQRLQSDLPEVSDNSTLSQQQTLELINDLKVHQIELEMENEELRGLEIRMQQSLDEFNELYDGAPVGYFTLDHNGRILRANLTGSKLLGAEKLFLLNSPFHTFVAHDHQDIFYLHCRSVFETQTTQSCETQLVKKDGTCLTQSQKMEAIGTLAGGIAHDFNNILFIMLGYTELAKAQLPVESPQAVQLGRVLEAGKRAADMVKQILTFSRKSQTEKRHVNLGPIIKEGLKFLRSSLPTTIQIRQTIDPELPNVLVDPTQVHQVLMNLCVNATYAMKNTPGLLSVELANAQLDSHFTAFHPPLLPGKYVKLTVSDSGQGIAPDIIDRIFDPYFTTKGPGEGTGLGLSVVHGIVKDHGGTITVRSELNKGSTFTIFIPAIKEKEDAQQEVLTGELPLGSERILLVDDEPDIAAMVRDILGGLGYQVEGLTSPVEALKSFQSTPNGFDLVITDLTMPKMTGNDVAAELIKIRPDIPIILCTGRNEEFDTDFADEKRFRAVFRKPVSKDDLARTVHRVLHPTPPAVLP